MTFQELDVILRGGYTNIPLLSGKHEKIPVTLTQKNFYASLNIPVDELHRLGSLPTKFPGNDHLRKNRSSGVTAFAIATGPGNGSSRNSVLSIQMPHGKCRLYKETHHFGGGEIELGVEIETDPATLDALAQLTSQPLAPDSMMNRRTP